MRSGLVNVIGIVAGIILLSAAPAHALGAKASLAGGVVSVSGRTALKSAPISWEGAVLTTTNKNGGFAFTTTIVPTDCIGTVSDGTSSVDVRIDGCSDVTPGLPGTGQTLTYVLG